MSKKRYKKNIRVQQESKQPFYIKNILKARTIGQQQYINAINHNKLVICCGPAGCGKSFIATAKAIEGLYQQHYERIIITRPMIQAGETTGYLPGDIFAKLKPYLQPIFDEMRNFISWSEIQKWINLETIEIVPFAYMRGRNFHHSFIIADECQNASLNQLLLLVTRYGTNSKLVINGDLTQSDLPHDKQGGLKELSLYIENVPNTKAINLTYADIVRERLVEDIVKAREEYAKKQKSSST